MQILGEGAELLCNCTNARAKRILSRSSSDAYKRRWKDLTNGPRLFTFLAAYFGVAMIGIGSRHLEKVNPPWVSQQGERLLFAKLPVDLYRFWHANFVAHSHRDTILFRKSIREQRIRFYGNQKLSEIVYSNSRLARDPPVRFSGDETVTRTYTRKNTEIRMRTSKKNESGILNQNLCGSNEGYATWREGDFVGSGYTFTNMAYPGKTYDVGSMFREKDMGNLLQLMFICGDYLRFKGIQLVGDSHFGHVSPLVFLRVWNVFSTCSVSVSRKGVSNIPVFSTKILEKEVIARMVDDREKKRKNLMIRSADIYSDSDSLSEYAQNDKREKQKKIRKMFNRAKSELQLFEKEMIQKPKGHFKVWKTELQLLSNFGVKVYIHAVHDSKVVYRLTTKYGAVPKVPMNVTKEDLKRKKRAKVSIMTSGAQRCFRKYMGFNDQSDAKRSQIGLSAKYFKRWPQKLLAKTLEDATINAYLNYLLDPACPNEPWPVFLIWLVDEFIGAGENMRKRLPVKKRIRRSHKALNKKLVPGSDEALEIGANCKGGKSIGAQRSLPMKDRTKMCAFCRRSKAQWKCRACGLHLCMQAPQQIGEKKFPPHGPTCFLRIHGFHKFPKMQ